MTEIIRHIYRTIPTGDTSGMMTVKVYLFEHSSCFLSPADRGLHKSNPRMAGI